MALRKAQNRAIGNLGEEVAGQYLRGQGYRLLERNYRCRGGEIDIIAEHDGTLVFVEVKTRSPRSLLRPEEAVDETKRDRIRNAAKLYLSGWRDPSPQRFDIVSIMLDDNDRVTEIHLLPDAFR